MIYLVTGQQSMFSPAGYSLATVEESLEYLKTLDIIGFDTETMGLDPFTKPLLSMQLGDETKQYVVDCKTIDPKLYKDILEDKVLIMHNAKFDLRYLFYYGIVPTKIYDSFLTERILTTGIDTVRRSLDAVVYRYCKIELDKTVRGSIHREGLSTRVIKYAANDVKYLHQVKRKQEVALQENNLTRTASLDNEFVVVLAYIEFCGFYMNPQDWRKKCEEDKKDLDAVKNKLDQFILDNPDKYPDYIDNQLDLFAAGVSTKINWASSKQVISFMQSLGVDTLTKDKDTGMFKHSVDKKVLGPQKKKHPIISTYIEFTEHQKVVSTYGENWFEYINPVTKRVHSNYTQIMNTGRLSSGQKGDRKRGIPQMPNMQNIPSDKRTRGCFQSEPGNVLIVSDYSGQEQIVLANKSLDPDLLYFYSQGLG
jgi:DNA polymerase I-like protein with 3'-5' exonuclease and polymerase domains